VTLRDLSHVKIFWIFTLRMNKII